MDEVKRIQDRLEPMMGLNKTYFGLDLGTYRNIFAYRYGNEKPTALFNGSDRTTRGGVPSLVWIRSDGTVLAGGDAERQNCMQDPEGVCESPKMKLSEQSIELHGKQYSPEEIMRYLVQNVRDTCFRALEQDNISTRMSKLVVGFPARFEASEVKSLMDILQSVFPGVTIRLVPEPILAANNQRYFDRDNARPLLVFDMGAGTFDACYLEKNPRLTRENRYPFIIRSTEGSRVAGNQIDELTAELILEQLERELPEADRAALETLRDPRHADHMTLLQKARDVKETLSSSNLCDFFMSSMSSGARLFTQIRREDFERKIRPAIQANVDRAYDVLQQCCSSAPDIDVLMVGASCYIPLIKTMLMERFNWLPEERFALRSPEKAVALGAALYCSDPDVVEALPTANAFGIATYLAKEQADMIHIRIPSGAMLPFQSQGYYSTLVENQDNIRFDLYEVERGKRGDLLPLSGGKATGYRIEHKFGRKVPAGTVVQLTITLDENGLLTLQVDDLGVTQNPPTMVVIGKSDRLAQ